MCKLAEILAGCSPHHSRCADGPHVCTRADDSAWVRVLIFQEGHASSPRRHPPRSRIRSPALAASVSPLREVRSMLTPLLLPTVTPSPSIVPSAAEIAIGDCTASAVIAAAAALVEFHQTGIRDGLATSEQIEKLFLL